MKGWKTFLVWGALVGAFVAVFNSRADEPNEIGHGSFLQYAEEGVLETVWVDGRDLYGRVPGSEGLLHTTGTLDAELQTKLQEQGALRYGEPEEEGGFGSLLFYVLLAVGLVFLVLYFLRKVGGGGAMGANVFELRKSKARLVSSETTRTTFEDVGGCHEAKDVLADLVDFLRAPERWIAAGARLPRGVLLEGPPGCGKTLLARAVAGETEANFYSVSASEFVEMFVGVGAARVRDTFETAAANVPAVVFIDELDAVGRRRGSGTNMWNEEREQTLNQLLACLDGFEARERVVVIAATNRADILDPALMRAGRFDRRVRVPNLNREARLEVLRIHARDKPLDESVSLEDLADRTDGYTGAQLESLTNEAALLAVRRTRKAEDGGRVRILAEDLDAALQPATEQGGFDKLDAVLVESASQLAEPTGRAVVRLRLEGDVSVEGEIVWVDGAFIKVRDPDDGTETIVPKHCVRTLQSVDGTEPAHPVEAVSPWVLQQREGG